MQRYKKVAFDFHGVLESYPDKLKPILETLISYYIVIILSGPPLQQIRYELTQSGYKEGCHYDHIISVVDWLKGRGVEMELNEHGSWYCKDDIWWSSKAKICAEQNIDILFDDKLEYKKYIIGNTPLFIHIK